ncbi:hypothetical protein [Phorcysia thermohydrogeniphila]|uniref:GGDEF domain-containing protein n=1 Tax=Phorcysia thermohydrogeniphila TaxID=936138 RepID=A0A4R1GEA4_9BACT|nr:hypothetical protein [Phorcysia thermohydrogeniphila]TCK06524.1 GGDEF domain-containing protein [Phorcysia thermohydrogeniphila]
MKVYVIKDLVELPDLPVEVAGELDLEALEKGISEAPEAFLVYTANPSFLEKACQAIRHLSDPLLYLRPILLLEGEEQFSRRFRAMADVVLPAEAEGREVKRRLRKVDRINQQIDRLNVFQGVSDSNVVLKVLRYIYTRGGEIEPVRDAFSFFGLSYPPLENFFTRQDFSVFNVLDLLEEKRFLTGEFYEKVHFCNKCHFAFLNFMEVCPNCGSGDLTIENLIHHFPCAYVGPEEDFKKGDTFVCPKCGRELKGLGVDFDRPATIYRCNHCRYVTQDPQVKTVCFYCGKESFPEDLILRTVKAYRLTALGENVAIYGMESLLFTALKENLDLLSYETFLTILKLEIERCRRYGVRSSLVAFQIVNINEIYGRLGSRALELFKEISAVIRAVTRKCDVVSIMNESLILILLPHTPEGGAEVVLNRMVTRINQLLLQNLGIEVIIKFGKREISDTDREPVALIETLLNEMVLYEKKGESAS